MSDLPMSIPPMSELIVRPGRAEDIAALDRLFGLSFRKLLAADYPPSTLVTAIPLIGRVQPRLVTCGTYFVASLDGVPVGGGGWTRNPPFSRTRQPGEGHIRHFATDAERTRCGIARAVMDRVLDDARRAGVTTMHCVSTLTAEPFYLAMGFRKVRPVEVTLAPGIDFRAVAMVRSLDR